MLASLLILAGSTGDRLGRRRTFQTGLVLFTAGLVAVQHRPGLGWLIAFRMVQAVGGSMLNPVAMSIITNVFTDPRERAKAIGVWGGVVGISLGVGPIVGGLLTETIGWRAIFWVNVPIGVAAFVLAAIFVPESRAPRARRVDPVGQLLVHRAAGHRHLRASSSAPASVGNLLPTVALFVVAVAALIGLLVYEPRRPDPLIELRFFRSLPFTGATVIAVCAFGCVQRLPVPEHPVFAGRSRPGRARRPGCSCCRWRWSSPCSRHSRAGSSAPAGRECRWFIAGICMTLAGLALTGLTNTHQLPVADRQPRSCTASASVSVNAPITNTAVSGMPREQAGVAAAVASTSRQVGASLGRGDHRLGGQHRQRRDRAERLCPDQPSGLVDRGRRRACWCCWSACATSGEPAAHGATRASRRPSELTGPRPTEAGS